MTTTRWQGYWEQGGYGRQPMHRLVFRFASEQAADGGRPVEGEGTDIIGPFTFNGTFNADGSVVLIKQYIGQHQVLYVGRYDGEGTVTGEWAIDEYRGRFALQLERGDAESEGIAVAARRIGKAPAPADS